MLEVAVGGPPIALTPESARCPPPQQRAPIMRTMGGSIEEFADRWAAVQRFAYDRLDAVRGVLEAA